LKIFRFFVSAWFAAQAFTLFGIGARAQELDHLQGLNNPTYHLVDSQTLDRAFHIFVRLPEGYENSSDRYPVVYLLDGGHTFPMLASYYRYLSYDGIVPKLIFVGISYGTDDFGDSNFRGTDFTAAAPSHEQYGGAPLFQNFLRQELLPFIENRYRADPERRIIFGQSLGGQFVLYTAFTDPDLFWGHIASNPALHRNLPYFLEYRGKAPGRSSMLFVSAASDDHRRFREPLQAWIAHWSGVEERPWLLETERLAGEGHFSAAPGAFKKGLLWLLSHEAVPSISGNKP
jgi:predicted alpha/beta superfamily hydrolase